MFKKPTVLYAVIAAAALFVGLLVYLFGRQPDHVYFLFHGFTLAHAPHSLFGALGNYLPSFVHVYAFILLTAAVAGSSNARLLRICTVWFVIASLFECGQHPAVSPLIAAALPAWFARVPVLDHTAAYFLNGTFDLLDLLSIATGTIAAYLTVVLIRNRAGTRLSENPLRNGLRFLAISGLMSIGMLTIIGSGGDGTALPMSASVGTLNGPSALFIDVVNDRLYVANTNGNSVLVYDNASILNGGTTPNRTLKGSLTSLSAPTGIYVDTTRNLLYVSNGTDQILVFSNAATVTGNIAPVRSITGLSSPNGVFVDIMTDRLYVANMGANSVLVFNSASTANGSPAPDRVISTPLNLPRDVFVDTGTDRLYVANAGDNSILVFNNASTVNNPATTDRTLSLSVSTGPWGIFVDDTPIVIGSTASLDGYARNDSFGSSSGSPATGDKESDFSLLGVGWRQLYSFDIANIGSSATIVSAILRLYQCDVQGSPYTSLGNVIVDHVNYGGVFDPSGSAYNDTTVASNIGILSTTTSLGYRSLDVTSSAQNDLTASRVRSQYRLRFSNFDSNSDGNDDFAQFTDAEDSPCISATTNQPPQLAITLGNSSHLYISGNGDDTLLSYNNANTVSGSITADHTVTGGFTTFNAPRGIAVDMARNQVYIANFSNNSILVFNNARTVSGDVTPSRTITP